MSSHDDELDELCRRYGVDPPSTERAPRDDLDLDAIYRRNGMQPPARWSAHRHRWDQRELTIPDWTGRELHLLRCVCGAYP